MIKTTNKKCITVLLLNLVILIISMFGCQYNSYEPPNKIVINTNFKPKLNYTENFIITSYSKLQPPLIKQYKKITNANKELFVYIEGDGRAWINKFQLSSNPTPLNPLALKLATLDPNPNVLYIARPCQFTDLQLDQNCHSKYWSDARYSTEVINSINEVIEQFKLIINKNLHLDQNNMKDYIKIHLIGYSGGGNIAGLIASIRNDVMSIRTIAGNLDHDAVSNFHQTTKLTNSLNLIDYIPKIKNIPQIHYIGEHDQIIPINIIKKFVAQINHHNELYASNTHNNSAIYKIVNCVDHYHGWEKFWKNAVYEIPKLSK